tara:strand:+ start:171 stop:1226 length:1056 start_codon:yes stop_codon:yes gene_type:complete
MTPKRNKPKKRATRNQKGLQRIERTVNKLRNEFEDKYPFAVDFDAVQLPEGLPSFTDFVLGKESNRAYNEVDPVYEYQKTVDLPFGLQLQRWRGKKTSPDGKNYRVPYFTALKSMRTGHPKATGSKFGAGIGSDGKFTSGITHMLGSPGFSGYKDGHRKYMEQRSTVDKVKGIAGSVLPPLNYLTGQGASLGGRKVLPALSLAGWANTLAYGAKPDAKFLPLAARGIGNQQFMRLTPSKLVVPTAGIRVNPFGKAVRGLKRQSKKDEKKLDNKLKKGSKQYNIQLDKEKADFERQSKLYEKRYGFKPAVPEMTQGFRAVTPQTTGRRGEYRNPLYLKNGGIVPFMKPKKKR